MCKQMDQIRIDLARFNATGELPEPWAPEIEEAAELECLGHDSETFPEESGGYPRTIYCDGSCRRHEFDRRVDEINRDDEISREFEAIESGSVEPPRFGWLSQIGGQR